VVQPASGPEQLLLRLYRQRAASLTAARSLPLCGQRAASLTAALPLSLWLRGPPHRRDRTPSILPRALAFCTALSQAPAWERRFANVRKIATYTGLQKHRPTLLAGAFYGRADNVPPTSGTGHPLAIGSGLLRKALELHPSAVGGKPLTQQHRH
jgi:hypothetical protein